MKLSLIAIAACCAVSSASVALDIAPTPSPVRTVPSDDPGSWPPHMRLVDVRGTLSPQATPGQR